MIQEDNKAVEILFKPWCKQSPPPQFLKGIPGKEDGWISTDRVSKAQGTLFRMSALSQGFLCQILLRTMVLESCVWPQRWVAGPQQLRLERGLWVLLFTALKDGHIGCIASSSSSPSHYTSIHHQMPGSHPVPPKSCSNRSQNLV